MNDFRIDEMPAGENNDIVILSIVGYIDETTVRMLEGEIAEQVKRKRRGIIMNLEKVSYISSSGWGVLLREIREIREQKGDLVLIGMRPDVYDVYDMMEISSILRSFNTVEEAVDYLK